MKKEQMQAWVKKNCKFASSIFDSGNPEEMSNSELSNALINKYDDEDLVNELLNRLYEENGRTNYKMSKEEYYSFLKNRDDKGFWDKAKAEEMTTKDLINLYNDVGSSYASRLIIDKLADALPYDAPDERDVPDINDFDEKDIGDHPNY